MSQPDRPGGKLERATGALLRVGVVTATAFVLVGGVIHLVRHFDEPADHHTFRGEPASLKEPRGIVGQALALRGRGIIQLGLLLLIATPVARVVLSFLAFARQRDGTYVVLTLIVLIVLLCSLFAGT